MAEPARGVIVLGMHRSGTSAVTQLLEALGFHVGAADALKEKSWQNPHGFFERRDVRGICDVLLGAAKADWWKIGRFEIAAIPDLVVAEQQAVIRDLAAELGRSGRWALKEPRLCFLLPVFLGVLDAPRIVLVHRNPLEVAKSLRRRNAIPIEVGLALWEAYNLAALRHSRALGRIVIDYDSLVGRPGDVAAMLRDRLLAPAERASVDAARAATVIDPDLHREIATEGEIDTTLSPAQRVLAALLRAGGDDVAPPLSAKAGNALAEFEEAETGRRETEARLRAMTIALEHSAGDLKAQRDRTAKLRARIDELEKATPPASAEAAGAPPADAAPDDLRRRVASLAADIAVKASENERLHEANTALALAREDDAARIAELAAEVAELRRRIDLLGAMAAAREADWSAIADARPPTIAASGGAPTAAVRPPAIGRSVTPLGRVAFLSAAAGDDEPPPDPSLLDAAADYVLLTDRAVPPGSAWQARAFDFVHADPALTVAFVRLHPHLALPGYDVVIWADRRVRLGAAAEAFISAGNETADIMRWPGSAEAPVMVFRPGRPAVAAFLAEWWRRIDAAGSVEAAAFREALRSSPGLVIGDLGRTGADWRDDPRFVLVGDERSAG